MSNVLFNLLGGQQQPQAPMPNPAEYKARIDGFAQQYQQQGRDPTREFESLLQSGKYPADQLEFARKLGRAVAARLYGGK